MSGQNGYTPFQVDWREHPDRGEEYWDLMVSQLGPLKARQEVGCVTGDTMVTVRDKLTGEITEMSMAQLAVELHHV
jgi:hypothetical protein